MRGATLDGTLFAFHLAISTHAPLAGRDPLALTQEVAQFSISTHAPLAGRDFCNQRYHYGDRAISTHAPLAGRDAETPTLSKRITNISTHAPLAGRDNTEKTSSTDLYISTHAPLAGRDSTSAEHSPANKDFNPRAPCGARLSGIGNVIGSVIFQPTRPLRGATDL